MLHALQLPQRIGHRRIREDGVVPADRPRLVHVERLQVGVDPVASAHPRDDAQVRRHLAEECGALIVLERDVDVLAELGTGEVQVVLEQ
jgi:hypothetical protein